MDNIDVPAATSRGILVMNTPGGNTTSTAELAVSHILALARNIPAAVNSVKAGRWDRKKYLGTELTGKTIGIIGLGRIGQVVARWCNELGTNVIGYDPILAPSATRMAGIEPVLLDDIFKRSDFISLHTPLTAETKGLINRENLRKCKAGVRIVNCARGAIVDPNDLLDAINSGLVGGASLDVYPSEPPPPELAELINHEKVICTPHLGASTTDAQVRVAKDIAKQMCDVLEGGEHVGVINAPNMSFARRSKLSAYILLAEKMGLLQAQLLGTGKIQGMRMILQGKQLGVPDMARPMTAALLKGALSSLLFQEVNYVNAESIARDMGIDLEVSHQTDHSADYIDGLAVEFELDGVLNGTRRISGTVFADDPRIVSVDGMSIDFRPVGNILMFNNPDTSGMLYKVSTVLANNSINIANFSLGRSRVGGTAMSAISVDVEVPDSAIQEIRAIPGIRNVISVSIPSAVDPAFRVDESTSYQAYSTPMPRLKPLSVTFSSGPCKKRPGYSLSLLRTDTLGRSHRGKLGLSRLKYAIEETKRILMIPDDYLVGIVPASDTGAFEMAMWNMLGPHNIDVCHWESFGKGWFTDLKHLGLINQTVEHTVPEYGLLPDLSNVSPENDVLFTWNGTTSGVKVPNVDWISPDRTGLVFNDATSAVFAMDIDWAKVDVTTFSWQKVLGGEAAHGILILSPRAVERLETFQPERPLPKVFRMVKQGKLDRSIFEGSTINTPSMLCVEDYIDALEWARNCGGLQALIKRSRSNLGILEAFVNQNDWVNFLAKDPSTRSNTSVCLSVDLEASKVKRMATLLESEGIAYDIGSYRDAPPGLRIWCGATVEKHDLEVLTPWLQWAYDEVNA